MSSTTVHAQFTAGAEFTRLKYSRYDASSGSGGAINTSVHIKQDVRIGIGLGYVSGSRLNLKVAGNNKNKDSIFMGWGWHVYYPYAELPVNLRINQLQIPLNLSISLLNDRISQLQVLFSSTLTFNRYWTQTSLRYDTSVYEAQDYKDNERQKFWDRSLMLGLEAEKRWNRYVFYGSFNLGVNFNSGKTTIVVPPFGKTTLGVRYVIQDKYWPVKHKKPVVPKQAQPKPETPAELKKKENKVKEEATYPNYTGIQLAHYSMQQHDEWATGIYIYKRNYRRKSISPAFGLIYKSRPAGEYPVMHRNPYLLAELSESFIIQGRHVSWRMMPIGGIGIDKGGPFLGSIGIMTGFGLSVWRLDANWDVGFYNFRPTLRFGVGYVMSDNQHLKVREPWRVTRAEGDTTPSQLRLEIDTLKQKWRKDVATHKDFNALRLSYFWDDYYESRGIAISYFRRNYRRISFSPLASIAFSEYEPWYLTNPDLRKSLVLDAGAMLNIQGHFAHLRATAQIGAEFSNKESNFTGGLMLGTGFTLWRIESNFEIGYYHNSVARISLGYVFSDNNKIRVR